MTTHLKKFSLPGKDSRCIRCDGRVFKIKTFMTPPTRGNITDYVTEDVLQREIKDVFRAVLAIPPTEEPVIMRTKHFVIKPECKKWKLPLRVDFKESGQSLLAHQFMYVLHIRVIEQRHSVEASPMDATQTDGSKSCDDTGDTKPRKMSPSPSTSKGSKRQKRQLFDGSGKSATPHLRSNGHRNTRLAPHHGVSVTRSQSIPRKKALRLSSISEIDSDNVNAVCGKSEDGLDGNNSERKCLDEEKNRMDDEITRHCRWREASPELESGYSCQMHAKAVLGSEIHQWRNSGRPYTDQFGTSSIGDQGPLAAKPSDDGAARVAHIFHPGRERVEQHILAERLRLQEMATAAGDAPTERQVTHGFVRQMIQAVVSPVKILFSGKK